MSASAAVGVVGAGTMGRGIAQLCAQRGRAVLLYDAAPGAAASARAAIEASLAGLSAKGKLTASEAASALSRVAVAASLEDLSVAALVVEAVTENLAVKRALFRELDRALPSGSVLATNTSSLSVGAVAAGIGSPERALGMHFFNPPTLMKLVEVVRGPETGERAFRAAWTFAEELGKTPVGVKDTPGFIVNRVVRPFYLQALRLAGEGAGGIEEIDREIRELGALPMGPFELMDLIGLDVNLSITRVIYEALGRPKRLEPHFIQERLVEAGRFGRKTGSGFYLYADGRPSGANPEASRMAPPGQARARRGGAWARVRDAVIEEAEIAANDGVAAEADIDTAVRLAMNFPKGPFQWRAERG